MENQTKKRILVIDDEKTNRLFLYQTLKNDFTIYMAIDGKEGLDVAKKNLPDVILLDVIMPGIDGYEVISKLKTNAKTKDIPVVFVSGLSSEEEMQKGLSLGAIDFITKPFRIDDVKKKIHDLL
ncbi:MAG: response regulator, partial [Candidatus Cloacimonetes bacterium]|nr:response regulator [Candidatus Cloacimonadota bacterium]